MTAPKTKCEMYLQNEQHFKWFIEKYFGINKLTLLHEFAKDNKSAELDSELTLIWYHLPDSQFNIIANPKGWQEFLQVLEWQ